jgi:hypothetical protein
MRKILFFIALLGSTCVWGQLSVNILTPPAGIMDKQQLWNIIATNTENIPLTIQIQVTFTEITTGQPVFIASVSSHVLSPGTTQLTPANIGSVLYNIVNPDYQMDPGPNGLLPIGTFMACYDFMIIKYQKVVRECQQINIPPLGPLLLTQPANETELESLQPIFSWLPPSPVHSLNNLRYDFRLVEIQAGQAPADAIKDNFPVFTISNLSIASYPYTNSSPALETGKKYAWQVIAMNNLSVITKSEVWSFITKEEVLPALQTKHDPGYIKLKKEGTHDGYAVFWGDLRFDYLNETNDNTWNIWIEDLTNSRHTSFALPLDSMTLKRGQNLVNYDAAADKRFVDKHQYLLKVVNSRNEVWQIRFEYRKKENE